MDSDKWLEFTVFTGIDKYKSELIDLVKNSKKLKTNFDYMKFIAEIYYCLEEMLDCARSII